MLICPIITRLGLCSLSPAALFLLHSNRGRSPPLTPLNNIFLSLPTYQVTQYVFVVFRTGRNQKLDYNLLASACLHQYSITPMSSRLSNWWPIDSMWPMRGKFVVSGLPPSCCCSSHIAPAAAVVRDSRLFFRMAIWLLSLAQGAGQCRWAFNAGRSCSQGVWVVVELFVGKLRVSWGMCCSGGKGGAGSSSRRAWETGAGGMQYTRGVQFHGDKLGNTVQQGEGWWKVPGCKLQHWDGVGCKGGGHPGMWWSGVVALWGPWLPTLVAWGACSPWPLRN